MRRAILINAFTTETRRHRDNKRQETHEISGAILFTDKVLVKTRINSLSSSVPPCLRGLTAVMLICLLLLLPSTWSGIALCAESKWPGVDEAVVKKIAREHGREERASLFPQPEGDLQLFMFLAAGAVGGFAAGYYWRVLLEGKKRKGDEPSS